MRLLKLELFRASRDRAFRAALFLLLVSSVMACLYGSTQVHRQNQVMDQLNQLVTESDEVYFESRFKDEEDIGRAHYYLKQPTAHRPRPEAALSLGQRDLHSYHQSFGLRSLYTNLFDSGLENPSRSEAGHFDLAFVLVTFLPLVIIASTYNLLSREAEGRTLTLLRSSGCPLSKILLFKFLGRFVWTAALVALVVGASLLAIGASFSIFPYWLGVVLAYTVFWFGVSAGVVSFAWNSARSAGVLLAIWAVLTIVCPALLNLLLPREATQNGAALIIRCRQVVNNGWDREKSETQEAATLRNPSYAEAPITGEKFTWSWYYAMHDAGDQAVEDLAQSYFQGLREKDEHAFQLSFLLLPVRVQLLLDRLSGTDQSSHLSYYKFVIDSRLSMQERSLPRVFKAEKLSKEQLLALHDELPVLTYTPKLPERTTVWVIQLWIVALMFLFAGYLGLSRLEKRLQGSGS